MNARIKDMTGYKSKKAAAQDKMTDDEPVAWRIKWPQIGGGHKWIMVDKPLMEKEGFVNEPLYTCPQPANQSDWKDELIEQQEETILWQAERIAELLDKQLADEPAITYKEVADSMSIEAMKQALEKTLDSVRNVFSDSSPDAKEVIGYFYAAWKAAIEQTENTKLYHAPPQLRWVGLTDEEAQKAFKEHNCNISTHLAGILARAIKAKLKEKNT